MNLAQERLISNHPLMAVACRFLSAALSFALGIVSARYLGLEAFGAFSIITAAVSIATVVSLLGHETLAVRSVALTQHESKDDTHAYCRFATRTVLCASLVTLPVAALWLATVEVADKTSALWLLLLLVIFNAQIRLKQSIIRGAQGLLKSILPDGVIRPALAIIVLLLLQTTLPPKPVYFAIAILGSTLFAQILVSHWEVKLLGTSHSKRHSTQSTRMSWSIWISSMLAVALSQLATLCLGAVNDREGAAYYAAAEKYAGVISMLGQAAYLTIAARLAVLYRSRMKIELADLIRRTTRYVSLASLFAAIIIAVNADYLLTLFGPTFANGRSVLLILLTAVTLNSLAGPCGLLLQMTGHEMEHLYAMIIAVAVQVISLTILVPKNGAVGAAQAMLLANIAWNALMLIYIYKRLELRIPLAA